MYLRDRELAWDQPTAGTTMVTTAAMSSVVADVLSSAPSTAATSPRPTLPVVNLHGVDLHAVTQQQVITHIIDELDARRGGFVVTPNLDHLRRCVDDLSFSALVAEADLVIADGMPLVWAARVQGTP